MTVHHKIELEAAGYKFMKFGEVEVAYKVQSTIYTVQKSFALFYQNDGHDEFSLIALKKLDEGGLERALEEVEDIVKGNRR